MSVLKNARNPLSFPYTRNAWGSSDTELLAIGAHWHCQTPNSQIQQWTLLQASPLGRSPFPAFLPVIQDSICLTQLLHKVQLVLVHAAIFTTTQKKRFTQISPSG